MWRDFVLFPVACGVEITALGARASKNKFKGAGKMPALQTAKAEHTDARDFSGRSDQMRIGITT